MGLSKCQDTLIGHCLQKRISGGERKRTSIAIELIADPALILLDEPTSGLDSFMARMLCRLLNRLARDHNKTIIASIHAPSS